MPTNAATAWRARSRTTVNERWVCRSRRSSTLVGDHRGRDRKALRAGPFGEAAHDFVGARPPVAGDRADQRDELVLRAIHGRHLVGTTQQRPAGREREHQRIALGQIGCQMLCRGDCDARRRSRVDPVARLDRAEGQPEAAYAVPRPAPCTSAIGWSRRNLISFSLTASDTSRCTAWRDDVELRGDLVLPPTGDVVEPRRARGEIELAVLLAQPRCLPACRRRYSRAICSGNR